MKDTPKTKLLCVKAGEPAKFYSGKEGYIVLPDHDRFLNKLSNKSFQEFTFFDSPIRIYTCDGILYALGESHEYYITVPPRALLHDIKGVSVSYTPKSKDDIVKPKVTSVNNLGNNMWVINFGGRTHCGTVEDGTRNCVGLINVAGVPLSLEELTGGGI